MVFDINQSEIQYGKNLFWPAYRAGKIDATCIMSCTVWKSLPLSTNPLQPLSETFWAWSTRFLHCIQIFSSVHPPFCTQCRAKGYCIHFSLLEEFPLFDILVLHTVQNWMQHAILCYVSERLLSTGEKSTYSDEKMHVKSIFLNYLFREV